MFYAAKVEAHSAGQQGSYTILIERIAPPNTTAATFGGANFDVNGVSSWEMRYFDMVMSGTAVMIDGTSVGGTTVSVYVLDTSATQIHAEVGGGNSVSFEPRRAADRGPLHRHSGDE